MHTLSLKCLLPRRRCPIDVLDANFNRAEFKARYTYRTIRHNARLVYTGRRNLRARPRHVRDKRLATNGEKKLRIRRVANGRTNESF